MGLNQADLNPILCKNPDYQLEIFANKLSLLQIIDQHHVFVDFQSRALQFRSTAHLNAELLIKAVLGKKKQALKIIDVTAGFGKDSYLLALTGSEITAYESNPLMFALLKDGLHRTEVTNISLHQKNSLAAMPSANCDVIYLDPMYPATKKSAKHNKHMMFLQTCVGQQKAMDEDLFNQALQSNTKKIVIKRPIKAKFVLNKQPTSQITGKTIRFDIYAQ